MGPKNMRRRNTQEDKPMEKQKGKTTKAGENREKEQMRVLRGKPLIDTDKILLRSGVHSQH